MYLMRRINFRSDQQVYYSSSNSKVVDINTIGILTAYKPGKVTISAKAGGISQDFNLKVKKNPVVDLSIEIKNKKIRTGDVERIIANAYDRRKNSSRMFPLFFHTLVKLIMVEVYPPQLKSPVTDASLLRPLVHILYQHRSMVWFVLKLLKLKKEMYLKIFSSLAMDWCQMLKHPIYGFGLVSASTKAKTLR